MCITCFLSSQHFARKHTDPFWINYKGPPVHYDGSQSWEVGTVVQDVRWVTYHATTMTDEIEAMQENGTTSSKLKRSCNKNKAFVILPIHSGLQRSLS